MALRPLGGGLCAHLGGRRARRRLGRLGGRRGELLPERTQLVGDGISLGGDGISLGGGAISLGADGLSLRLRRGETELEVAARVRNASVACVSRR